MVFLITIKFVPKKNYKICLSCYHNESEVIIDFRLLRLFVRFQANDPDTFEREE